MVYLSILLSKINITKTTQVQSSCLTIMKIKGHRWLQPQMPESQNCRSIDKFKNIASSKFPTLKCSPISCAKVWRAKINSLSSMRTTIRDYGTMCGYNWSKLREQICQRWGVIRIKHRMRKMKNTAKKSNNWIITSSQWVKMALLRPLQIRQALNMSHKMRKLKQWLI